MACRGGALWPLLQGQEYPHEEFRSIYSGVGLGGLFYEDEDKIPTSISHDPARSGSWDELDKGDAERQPEDGSYGKLETDLRHDGIGTAV